MKISDLRILSVIQIPLRQLGREKKIFPNLLNLITSTRIKNATKNRMAEIADGSISLATIEPNIKLPEINMENNTIKIWLFALRL